MDNKDQNLNSYKVNLSTVIIDLIIINLYFYGESWVQIS